MISKKPGVVGGAACIAGTRIPVSCIAVGCAGASDEWILENYPTLTIEDINEARAYAAAHPEEMRDETESEEDELERLRAEAERLKSQLAASERVIRSLDYRVAASRCPVCGYEEPGQ